MAKRMKDNVFVKISKVVVGAAAATGAGAVVGCIIRGQDLSGLKGLGKLCAATGISGLSLAAGVAAKEAICKHVDDCCDAADTITDVLAGCISGYDPEKDDFEESNDDDETEVIVTEEELE